MSYSLKLYGQSNAIRFLTNALSRSALPQSLLFAGRDGVGKQTLARKFAQALNCHSEGVFADCTCASCKKIEHDAHADIRWIGQDEEERSIKIEVIRGMQEWVYLKPLEGEKKVFIINRAERLTEQAANALLKTLEEPPQNTHIVLLTEHKSKLVNTIISRVVEVQLLPLPAEELSSILKNDFNCNGDAHFLAYLAQGSLGRALEYKNDDYFSLKNKIIDGFIEKDSVTFFGSIERLARGELDKLLHIIAVFLNDVLLYKHNVPAEYLVNQDRFAEIETMGSALLVSALAELLTLVDETRGNLTGNVNVKLSLLRLMARCDGIVKGKR